ncbi:CHASE2 domain-containing protein [Thalassotalea piscium]
MQNSWYRHFINGLLITILVISISFISLAGVQKTLQRVEGILYDARLLITLPDKTRSFDEKVVIIDIDEKSIAEQGRYPWSRSKISQLVDNLNEAGVVVIAFDIVFSEPENNPVDLIIEKNQQLASPLFASIQSLKESVDADKELAVSLSRAEVVLGMMFDHHMDENSELNSVKGKRQLERVPSSVKSDIPAEQRTSYIPEYSSMLNNIQVLEKQASGTGFINSIPESDGFIRKAPLVIQRHGQLYPSLALEAARVYSLSETITAKNRLNRNEYWLQGLNFSEQSIPTNEQGQILIPFKGPSKSFEYISATDVLEKRLPQGKLDGAIAFVGTSAIGLADLRATSVGIQYPGVEVHANVFEGLMHPEVIPTEPDTKLAIEFILLLITGSALSFLMTKKGPMRIFYICTGALIFHLILNWSLWIYFKISLPQFQLLLLIIWLTLYYGGVGFIIESYRRKNIKGIFNQYVPPAYINKLLHTKQGVSLKPERREMSVLFADIRDFTQLSENFTPEELSEFMSDYLSTTTGIIFDNLGTIDKYVGDMVMAFWNAPLDDEKHAIHAVQTALAMVKSTKTMTDTFKQRGWPAVNIGVGVSTGDMIVGDMGSIYRKAYTVLGDEVNLGSRIESLTKFYGVSVLISDITYQAITSHGMVCRQIDTIKVKGKQKPVTIYEPIGLSDKCNEQVISAITLHQKGIKAYFSQDWDLAITIFTQLQNTSAFSTKLYDIYIKRINALKGLNQKEAWDGVFIHETK